MRNHSGFRGDLGGSGGREGRGVLVLPLDYFESAKGVYFILGTGEKDLTFILNTKYSNGLSFDLRRTPIYTTDRLKSWNIWGSVNLKKKRFIVLSNWEPDWEA